MKRRKKPKKRPKSRDRITITPFRPKKRVKESLRRVIEEELACLYE